MSPRRAHPRSHAQHDAKAAGVLRAYAQKHGWTPELPIPVEQIIEAMFDLRIDLGHIDEPPGQIVLGALDAKTRTIYLNESRLDLFERYIGPDRFTLAHELGHWLYDADDPMQELLFSLEDEPFCVGLDGDEKRVDIGRLREINANAFAARLLLPADLVRRALPAGLRAWSEVRARSATWGVSQTTLAIRLTELGLASPSAEPEEELRQNTTLV